MPLVGSSPKEKLCVIQSAWKELRVYKVKRKEEDRVEGAGQYQQTVLF